MQIIGIAGASGSGKSQLAYNIQAAFDPAEVMVLSEDNYYKDQRNLSMAQRNLMNYDHPDAMDHALLAVHLAELAAGRSVERPVYSFHEHCRALETVILQPPRVLVLEGILLFCEERLRNLIDLRVFMEVPLDICLIRRLERDVHDRGRNMDSVLSQYQSTVRAGYLEHILPSRQYADLLVPEGGDNPAAVAMLTARIQAMLAE
ncbi:MAG: uridine kinase [Gammaproteobacteria bacterium]|nr:uridine kinase [Gammaproteobacteria bacterium]